MLARIEPGSDPAPDRVLVLRVFSAELTRQDPFDALYQGFSILTPQLALEERKRADVMIAAERALPALRSVFG